jgi:predicted nucleic acid-binding protein
VIIADTSAIVALIDADDRHHVRMRTAFDAQPDDWVLPWAILPVVDYLLLRHVGEAAQLAGVRDVAADRWAGEGGDQDAVARAAELCARHRALRLGLVDGVVMGVAERLRADAIATLDERHFGAVRLPHSVRLFPRDL